VSGGGGHTIRTVVLAAAGVAVGVLVVLITALGHPSTFDPIAVLGKPAPAERMTTLDGHPLSLSAFRGKAVLVNFWNSWCEPCEREAPALDAFYTQHHQDGDFELIGIVHDDTAAAVRTWVNARDIPWPIAFDPQSHAALDFGTTGQPETYAIAPDGTIVAKRVGPASVADLTRLLAMARGEA
jgi:cytochrome c biogenesis protein CcmG, thiol:disulfide interchange protein DsbE